MGAFPVDRDNIDINAIKTSLRLLKEGETIGIFPEGTRNKIDDKISICVEPVLLKQNQLLATVEYEYNLVEYCGKSSGIQTMYGKGAGPNTCNSILFDLGLLVNEYKQDFMPSNSYEIVGNKGIKAKYFIQPKGKIDSYFVNKNFKKFIISKDLSSEELQHLMPSILFYARIID